MKRDEKVWKYNKNILKDIKKKYEKIWKDMKRYEKIWQDMKRYENNIKEMKRDEKVWK